MPVRPLCHGAWYVQVGVPLPVAQRLDEVGVQVGHLAVSSGWIQPRPIIRAAIQSVSIIMSRSIGSHAPSWLRTLAKNSALSLTSSV